MPRGTSDLAGDTGDTLGGAIEDAQRAQTTEAREVAERRYRDILWVHHAREHELIEQQEHAAAEAHKLQHDALAESVKTALAAVESASVLHTIAHQAAHDAHGREHLLEGDARDKAAEAVSQRLEGMNEFRGQLRDQASTFARIESLQAVTDRVIAIEKMDFGHASRSLGQGAMVAYIVTAISIVGGILGIVIVIANFATKP